MGAGTDIAPLRVHGGARLSLIIPSGSKDFLGSPNQMRHRAVSASLFLLQIIQRLSEMRASLCRSQSFGRGIGDSPLQVGAGCGVGLPVKGIENR